MRVQPEPLVHVFYCDTFVLPLPDGHRFPMSKYRLLRERVSAAGAPFQLTLPPAATAEQVCRAHAADYFARVRDGQMTREELRMLGFPWSAEMVERSLRSSGATLAACDAALAEGAAASLAGGTHHAGRARAQGFCVFNDAAIASLQLLESGAVERVLVVDCDVHQGNGTAEILADEPRALTLSLHGEKNFPARKAISDIDIGLADGCDDDGYLAALDAALSEAFARAEPQLVIYLAGADPWSGDRLGRLDVSKAGLAARDELVLSRCEQHGAAVATVMAGGYAPDVDDIVDIHFASVCATGDSWARRNGATA
jgi:acetoin utilization deacetylase AcuC-like enzyme